MSYFSPKESNKLIDFILGFLLGGIMALGVFNPAHASTYIAPDTLHNEDIKQWMTLEHNLILDPDEHINIIINGSGGSVAIGDQFIKVIEHLKNEKKEVVFIVNTAAQSEHAFIACHGTKVQLIVGAKLVFHEPYDKYLSLKAGHKVYDGEYSDFDYCIGRGYLTSFDVKEIMQLHDRIEVDKDLHKTVKQDWDEII